MAPISPRARLIATVIAAVASLIADRIVPLAVALLIVVALLARVGILRTFLRLVLSVYVPSTIMLMIVWGVIAGAPPGAPMHSDPRGAAWYGAIISLRLAVLGAVVQLSLLSIPSRLLAPTLYGWGLRGEGLVVALGVFAIGPELLLRSEQIITARKARGVAETGRFGRFREATRLLRPLFVWSIRSAVQRSEAWEQRALLLKVDRLGMAGDVYWPLGGALSVALSVAWFSAAVLSRWM